MFQLRKLKKNKRTRKPMPKIIASSELESLKEKSHQELIVLEQLKKKLQDQAHLKALMLDKNFHILMTFALAMRH